MNSSRWERYPGVTASEHAKTWLKIQGDLGLAANTLEAYGRALDDFLAFSADRTVVPEAANREHVAAYVRDLASRSHPRGRNVVIIDSGVGLANATLQQRLTAVRLFYDRAGTEGRP
jgi:site-specific recombinase XerD